MYKVTVNPREYQIPILNELNKIYDNQGYIRGILQAQPGTGKTYMSINFGHKFNKIIVLVPKSILADQWKSEFLSFTDLKERDISILEGSNLDTIKETINNSKVIITKPQSLLSQLKRISFFELYEIYKAIDLVIVDECHNYGALGYSKTISLFETKNILGLSATPWRKDINEFLLKNSIGDILIEADAQVLTPEIFIQSIPNSYVNFTDKEIFALKQRLSDYPQMLALFNMYLHNKTKYLEFLSQWIKWGWDQKRHQVILFSTNKLANKQAKILIEKYPELTDDILVLTGNTKNDAISIAKQENKKLKLELKKYKEELNQKVKQKELRRKDADNFYKKRREEIKILEQANIDKAIELYNKRIKEAKIIISNFNLLREGFDKKDLSFVIFGSPIIGKITVIQSLGRITRLAENKPTPIAFFPILEAFEKLNPQVKRIIINNIRNVYEKAKIHFK